MKGRPISVTILLLIVFFYTIWNVIRLYGTINFWDMMIIYNAYPGPIYHLMVSSTWIVIGIFCIIWVIKKKTWSILLLRVISVIYATWYWSDRFLFRNTLMSFWFPLIISLISLAIFMYLINLNITKNYFIVSKQ